MTGRFAYFQYLTVWTTPLLLGQMVLLARTQRLGAALRAGWLPVLVATLWFSFADHFAIAAGVWRFGDGLHLGLGLGGVPLEESLFFFLTSALVAFGVTLLRRS